MRIWSAQTFGCHPPLVNSVPRLVAFASWLPLMLVACTHDVKVTSAKNETYQARTSSIQAVEMAPGIPMFSIFDDHVKQLDWEYNDCIMLSNYEDPTVTMEHCNLIAINKKQLEQILSELQQNPLKLGPQKQLTFRVVKTDRFGTRTQEKWRVFCGLPEPLRAQLQMNRSNQASRQELKNLVCKKQFGKNQDAI